MKQKRENYAVIKIAHRQYIVEPDGVYKVDKFTAEEGDKVQFDVLLKASGDDVEVGTPTVEGAKVVVEVLDQGKGKKVTTNLFKAKSRYRRKHGHRQRVTTFKVLEIK